MLKGCDYTHFQWISHDALLPHQTLIYSDLNKTKTLYFCLTQPQFLINLTLKPKVHIFNLISRAKDPKT